MFSEEQDALCSIVEKLSEVDYGLRSFYASCHFISFHLILFYFILPETLTVKLLKNLTYTVKRIFYLQYTIDKRMPM